MQTPSQLQTRCLCIIMEKSSSRVSGKFIAMIPVGYNKQNIKSRTARTVQRIIMITDYGSATQVLSKSSKKPGQKLQRKYRWDISRSVLKKPSSVDCPSDESKKHGFSSTVPECKLRGKTRAKPDGLTARYYNSNSEAVSKLVDMLSPSQPTALSTIAYPSEKTVGGDDEFFFDWSGFSGIGLTHVRQRHVDFLVEELVKGRFFVPREYPETELFDYALSPTVVEVQPNTGNRFDFLYRSSIGVVILVKHDPEDSDKIDSLAIRFTGKPLKALIPRNNQLKIAQLIDMVVQIDPKMHLQRGDIAHSFPLHRLDAEKYADALTKRNFCGFKKRRWTNDFLSDESEEKTYSFILGNTGQKDDGSKGRRSDKIINLYDERKPHGRDRWRLEGRFYGKYARFIQEAMIAIYNDETLTSDQKNTKIVEWMRDFIYSRRTFDLVERESIKAGKYRKDYKRLGFWQNHVDLTEVNAFTYRFASVKSTVQGSFDHLFNRGLGALASIDIAQGRAEVHKFVDALLDAYHSKRNGMTTETVDEILMEMALHEFRWNIKLFSPDLQDKLRKSGYYQESKPTGDYTQPNILYRRELRTYPSNEQLSITF